MLDQGHFTNPGLFGAGVHCKNEGSAIAQTEPNRLWREGTSGSVRDAGPEAPGAKGPSDSEAIEVDYHCPVSWEMKYKKCAV